MNTLYLVCSQHPQTIHALRLGERHDDTYAPTSSQAKLERFFEEHKLCGGGFDHFTIAYAKPKDHDLPVAKPLADVVHLSLHGKGA